MPNFDASWFFGGPDGFDFFQNRNRFPNAQGASDLTGAGAAHVVFTVDGIGTLTLVGAGIASVTFTAVGQGAFSTLAGAGAASVRFVTSGAGSLTLSGSGIATATFTAMGVGTNSTVQPVPTQHRKRHGGGIPSIIRREPIAPRPEYTPKLQPVGLMEAYDKLFENGDLSLDEWVAVQALYGVTPVMA